MPKDQPTLHDGNELTNSLWISPKEAIKKAWNGEIKMILPTSKNLEQTFDFNSTNELISFYKVRGLQRSNLFCLNLRKLMASGKVDCQMMRGMKIFSDGKR